MNQRVPQDIGNPSTPPRLRSRRSLSAAAETSSRPLPPWPVSPGPYSTPIISPQTNNHHHRHACPGAPRKNRYPRNDDDERNNNQNNRNVLGIVPRRLDFGLDATFETDEPILLSPPPPPPPSPRTPLSHDEDPSFPVLGMRPLGRKGLSPSMDSPSMGVVPDHSPATTPQRASNLAAQSPSSRDSSSRDSESEWQR